ncbi:MAG: serine/threonine-protein kinase [Pseudomonadota bacterium]
MTALGGYALEAAVGRGRGSTVYLARSVDGARVALKAAKRAKDFHAEFAVARSLRHPYVVDVLDHGIDGGQAFLVMEHCAGGDLARCPPQPADAGAMFLQAAEALAYLHRQGWVHRDVKPANLLLRADGSLALADLGSAARRGEGGSAVADIVVGTPRYAAPEQSRGAPAEPAADVYALGLVLYEWLCGRPAYPGETIIELLCQHLLAQVPPLPARHAGWQPLLDAMLAKEAGRRPADGAAVLRQLKQFPSIPEPSPGGGAEGLRNPS